MDFEIPKIDSRGAKQIYEQAVMLAEYYCPEWKPDENDIGSALLKLFARLSEIVIGQINRIPEKHLLAFYDLMGLDHLRASAAKVPLTFKIAEGSKEALVPARTKVASSQDPTVIFETMEPLTAVNCVIKAAYSLNPWEDKFTNHSKALNGSETGFPIFGGALEVQPVKHILYLADDAFGFITPASVTLNLYVSNYQEKFKAYFAKCADGAGRALQSAINTDNGQRRLQIGFTDLLIPRTVIDAQENNWLSLSPETALPLDKSSPLPEISNITADILVAPVIPEMVLFNDTPVDRKKSFYPFGETPKIGDALYIGCEEAFSRFEITTDALVEVNFKIKGGGESGTLALSWEYWDGGNWSQLKVVSDGTNRFLKNSTGDEFTGTLKFNCPPVMNTEINGIASRWIRVRITSGGYGAAGSYQTLELDAILKTVPVPTGLDPAQAAKYQEELKSRLGQKGITSGFMYSPPLFTPPVISNLTLKYSYTKKIQYGKTDNNFEYQELDLKKNFKPFIPTEGNPAFYLGFDTNLANQPVTLFVSLKTGPSNAAPVKIRRPGYEGEALADKTNGFIWKYAGGPNPGYLTGPAEKLADLTVNDETDLLSKSGLLKIIIPSDITKQKLFGEVCYWIKIGLKDGSWFEPPIVKGIFPNTIWAENAVIIENELLGSSNGKAGQVFNFSRKSLLGEEIIEIKEPNVPSEDELLFHKATNQLVSGNSTSSENPWRVITNDSGDPAEVWVRWYEVKTFGDSNSLSRHYILDRINGKILFGDGRRGMIPPALPNNLLAREYKSGGGQKGNQKAKTITELKTTIPNLDSATNYEAASGGRDLETIGNLLNRAPYSLKTNNRAVTSKDFEWLALEATPEVSRVKCAGFSEGKIKVIIAPVSEKGGISPDPGLINYVESYLKERVFILMNKDRIEVTGPVYKKIDINVRLAIKMQKVSESALIAEKVIKRLELYFKLGKGGQEGKGWDFGQDIYLSEVATVIEEVAGIDYIADLKITKLDQENREEEQAFIDIASRGPSKTWVTINDYELPCLGEIAVILSGGQG